MSRCGGPPWCSLDPQPARNGEHAERRVDRRNGLHLALPFCGRLGRQLGRYSYRLNEGTGGYGKPGAFNLEAGESERYYVHKITVAF